MWGHGVVSGAFRARENVRCRGVSLGDIVQGQRVMWREIDS